MTTSLRLAATMNASNCSAPPAEQQQHYFFPAVYIVAMLLGLPGNLAALYVFALRVRPRTAFSVYISNLALSDVLLLCTLPLRIHYHLRAGRWHFGDVACRLTGTLFFAATYTSIFFMTCICVDRYLATVRPHAYLRRRSAARALAVSGALWAAAAAAALVFVLLGPLETARSGSCFENFASSEWSRRLGAYSVLSLILGSLLPSAVILVCYPLAARRIAAVRTRAAGRAVRVIYGIMAITALCFLPGHVAYLLHFLRRVGVIRSCAAADAIYVARRVTMALVVLNTCLDPLLYYVTTSHCSWGRLRRTWLYGRLRRNRGVYTIAVG